MRLRQGQRPSWEAIGVLLLSTALYAHGLSLPSIWFDEGWSWHLARMAIPEMLKATAADRSPFLYYLLLHCWIRIAGESEWALRAPSLAFGVLAAALAMRLADRGWGRPAGALAAFTMALSPFWLYYVQEARMYSMLAAGTLAAWTAMEAVLRRPSPRRFGVWTLLAAGTALTHYYGLLPVGAMAIGLGLASVKRPAARRGWMGSVLALALLIGPWLAFARGRLVQPEAFVRPPTTARAVLDGLAHGFWPGAWAWLPALLLAAVGAVGGPSARRWIALTLGMLALALIALVGIFPRFALFHPRYLIFLWVLWVVGLAGGAVRLGRALGARMGGMGRFAQGWAGGLALLPLWGMLLGPWRAWQTDPHRGRDPYREAVAHVVRQIRPGEAAIALRANWAVLYYWTRLEVPTPLFMGPEAPVWEEAAVRAWLEEAHRRSGPPEGPWRLWLFGWQQEVVDPLGLFDGLLLANGFEVGGEPFGSLWVAYYETWPPFRARPLRPLRAEFAGAIQLRGAHLRPPRWPGDVLGVTLAWARVGPVPRPPRMFVHVLDPSGRLVAQRDGPLPNDLVPISGWPLDHAFPVFVRVRWPPDLHGTYTIRVGLYDAESGQRWPARWDGAEGDSVPIENLEVP